ncbi:hypothetical protein [Natronorubrum daqingense]|uniref:Uncharacterized protein n=1 Tax=Natronorubrum daqingense TaxID=588898 RepID=A0A1N7CKL7_9EURY|nr:hypothetical protein [Natronorubrum daqingense]APX96947.1 hypothetical protein BB347_10125 [Natronorubrum daqingense]SIR64151.1 hypothetical protein SAMN05421809_1755 [Natronorubrum daqingense]
MDVPTDRLLLMLIVATGFAVAGGGWAASLVHAEATGIEEIGLRVAIGVVFFLVLLAFWTLFSGIDDEAA